MLVGSSEVLTAVSLGGYQDASKPLKEALELDGGNLDAWKTRIWLSVPTEDHDDALATMERLAQRMPTSPVSAECERKSREFAGFTGQVFGYAYRLAEKLGREA